MKTSFYPHIFIAVMIMAMAAACSNSSTQDSVEAELPVSPFERLCGDIDYSDTTRLHNEQQMKKLAYVMVRSMQSTDSVAARKGLAVFFNGLRHDEAGLSLAMRMFDKYLNYPVSRYRNEEMYINLLSTLLATDSIPPVERELAAERLRIVSLNRPGTVANDFQYETPDGARRSLHDAQAPMTLLIFYNPECSPCEKILAEIAANPAVNDAIKNDQLAVVAIYAEGNRDVWRGSLAKMPKNWTVGYDMSGILDRDIYDLPAMPTLYLLDSAKRVLLKDPDHRILGSVPSK